MGLVGLLVALPVMAQTGEWETVSTGAITVKSRPRQGSAVKEVWAEGVMHADVQDIQSAVLDAEAYPSFMPFVKESRYLGKADADGGGHVYTRLDLPFVSSRDYVIKVTVQKKVGVDGSGEFSNSWVADPDRIPARHSVTRLRLCEGSWEVYPLGGGKSRVVYRAAVDPGGWIPSSIAETANKKGVTDTFNAMEKEAKRRQAIRLAKQKTETGTASNDVQPVTPPGA